MYFYKNINNIPVHCNYLLNEQNLNNLANAVITFYWNDQDRNYPSYGVNITLEEIDAWLRNIVR